MSTFVLLFKFYLLRSEKPNSQLVYGRNPIIDAIESGKTIEKVFIKDSLTGDLEKEIRALCKAHDIPLKRVPLVKLDKLTRNRNHQGLAAFTSLISYQRLEDVIPHLYEQGVSPMIMILDNIQDIRNIGAIARSCEVLGAHAIVLSGKYVGTINEDAIKTSAGALYRIPVCKEKNSLNAIDTLNEYGIKVVGTSLKAKSPLQGNLKGPIAVIMGSEDDGLHITIEHKCQELVKIPQVGDTDSLNVSVAAGILLYELYLQNIKA